VHGARRTAHGKDNITGHGAKLKAKMMIRDTVKKILGELPEGVALVGAAKTRTVEEVLEAVDGGLRIVGENYVQEAEKVFQAVGGRVKYHMIGHLQTNKAKKAVQVFDVIETVDSAKLSREIDRQCEKLGKVMEVLIEVNSGEEPQKAGAMPADVLSLAEEISKLQNVRLMGLMTMGPISEDPEVSRPFFRRTRSLFDALKATNLPNVQMRYLSMGMSDSYRIAIEEGANMVRIGTAIFGERHYDR
jgi:pyridoxal phosphate enzyme (YggS family)